MNRTASSAGLLFFDHVVHPAFGPLPVGTGKADLISRIDGAFAEGGTALYYSMGRRAAERAGPAAPTAVVGPPGTPAPTAVTVTMLYGTEKRDFIEEMAATFQREHPQVRIQFQAAGSLEAADRILDGKELPAVFSPADSLVLQMLASANGTIWSSASCMTSTGTVVHFQ
jgi:hypothetical protein